MKTLKFTNENLGVNVSYITDQVDITVDNFTIYQVISQDVNGVENYESLPFAVKQLGFKDKQQTYTMVEAIAFAAANNLTLTVQDQVVGTQVKNTLTALAITSDAAIAIESAVPQVETVTIPATADATQGDYIVLMKTSGETIAAWLDIDADGTEPTGAEYLAADSTLQVPIVTGGTAIENAALLVAALVGEDWVTDVTVLDNEDGTITFTQDIAGAVVGFSVNDAGDTGEGSISTAVDTAGVNGEDLNIELEAEGVTGTILNWATEDTLPGGVSLTSEGFIVGMALEEGVFEVDITVTDAFGVTDTKTFTLTSAAA